jgi:hypothetical protein
MMRSKKHINNLIFTVMCGLFISSCAEVAVPDARNVNIPSPVTAEQRRNAVNERPDSVMYLPLGEDVLVPSRISGGSLPDEKVGPFELRSETLAGALQLILADYDISIAFETEEGLNRQVTVANLKGPLAQVVNKVCSLADLYCSYEDGGLIVKDRQTFTVTLPPLGNAEGGDEFINDTIQGLGAVLGEGGSTPVSDPTTRTIIYTATARTSKLAENYFQRLRANTAMVVFETYIWEVSLNSGNSTGIDYTMSESFDKFKTDFTINGSVGADFTNPISIGLPQTAGASPADLVEFLSQFGAVKTISQPQITMLSGANAELRIADTENYVSEVTSTISGDQTSTSVSTDSVDSGFTLTIGSQWDKSTVYANVDIELTNVDQIENFTFSDSGDDGTDTIIQLPQTTERQLTTQIRVRPGDSVLIGGLVRETDNFNSTGPGFMEPILPSSRTATTQNLELVILLRPRVVVYTANDDSRYLKFVEEKNKQLVSQRGPSSLALSPPLPTPVEPAPRPIIESSSRESRVSPAVRPAPIVEAPVIEMQEPTIVTPEISEQPAEVVIESTISPIATSAPVIEEPVIEVQEPTIVTPEISEQPAETVIESTISPIATSAPVIEEPVIEAPEPIIVRPDLFGQPETPERQFEISPASSSQAQPQETKALSPRLSEPFVSKRPYEPIRPSIQIERKETPSISVSVPNDEPAEIIEMGNSDFNESQESPPELFDNTESPNVYEAYERSKNPN